MRGSFPAHESMPGNSGGKKALVVKLMRNLRVTAMAPTGTISLVAGTTSGIEPIFAVSYIREVLDGTKLLEAHPIFERMAREKGWHSKDLILKVAHTGSVKKVREVPPVMRKLFVTAHEVSAEWHVKIQAAFQKHTDLGVSKTVNLSATAKIEDVERVFILAHALGCKGITAYRYNSQMNQVLTLGLDEK